MPQSTVRSTYSLDLATVRDLERLARRLGTSKSEVLRRAVRALVQQEPDLAAQSLQALNELQSRADLSQEHAKEWASQVRDERIDGERKRTNG